MRGCSPVLEGKNHRLARLEPGYREKTRWGSAAMLVVNFLFPLVSCLLVPKRHKILTP